jgi:hypothetical protein
MSNLSTAQRLEVAEKRNEEVTGQLATASADLIAARSEIEALKASVADLSAKADAANASAIEAKATAEKATTKYVACAEDDTVYTKEHFAFRPPDDTFAYNEGHIEIRGDNKFIHRGKRNMSTCIANRDLMVDTLRKRFEKYPIPLEPAQTGGFAEPGRYEWKLKLPPVKIMGFSTDPPPVVFWHRPSLGGIRALKSSDVITTDHPYWGNAKEMFDKFYKKP